MNFAAKRVGWGATLVFLAALGLASCRPPAAGPPPSAVVRTFVGDAACAVCHEKEARTHRGSRHTQTLRPMTGAALGRLVPAAGRIPETGFTLVNDRGDFSVTAPGISGSLPLALAFGSGKSGMTFVALNRDEIVLEVRKSYFPVKKTWYATPGLENVRADKVGKIHSLADGRKCVGCHATMVPETATAPERKFFGVGCEACHGPGSAHVAASEAGDYDRDRPENLARLTGAQLGERCGRCHRTAEEIASGPEKRKLSNRFQVYGLAQSACFKQSGGKLSCVTCHDPHADAGRDPKPYEAVCLKCHTAPQTRACPVQPTTGCVRCHMPSKPAMPGSALPTSMADHWIRARPTR